MDRETNGRGDAVEFPKIISVDDHIIEPPDLWTRLPKAMAELGAQCQREKGAFAHVGSVCSHSCSMISKAFSTGTKSGLISCCSKPTSHISIRPTRIRGRRRRRSARRPS